jgi:hypothetical protein
MEHFSPSGQDGATRDKEAALKYAPEGNADIPSPCDAGSPSPQHNLSEAERVPIELFYDRMDRFYREMELVYKKGKQGSGIGTEVKILGQMAVGLFTLIGTALLAIGGVSLVFGGKSDGVSLLIGGALSVGLGVFYWSGAKVMVAAIESGKRERTQIQRNGELTQHDRESMKRGRQAMLWSREVVQRGADAVKRGCESVKLRSREFQKLCLICCVMAGVTFFAGTILGSSVNNTEGATNLMQGLSFIGGVLLLSAGELTLLFVGLALVGSLILNFIWASGLSQSASAMRANALKIPSGASLPDLEPLIANDMLEAQSEECAVPVEEKNELAGTVQEFKSICHDSVYEIKKIVHDARGGFRAQMKYLYETHDWKRRFRISALVLQVAGVILILAGAFLIASGGDTLTSQPNVTLNLNAAERDAPPGSNMFDTIFCFLDGILFIGVGICYWLVARKLAAALEHMESLGETQPKSKLSFQQASAAYDLLVQSMMGAGIIFSISGICALCGLEYTYGIGSLVLGGVFAGAAWAFCLPMAKFMRGKMIAAPPETAAVDCCAKKV